MNVAMKTLVHTLLALALLSTSAHADPLAQVVAVLAAEDLPAGLGVAEVHLPATLASVDVAPDDVSVVWPQAPRAGRSSARVAYRSGKTAKRTWVPITIAALGPAAVATHELHAGDVIDPADFKTEARPGTHAAPASVIGSRVTDTIAAGAAIDAMSIAQLPPVARGTEITVRVRRAGFTVTTKGALDRAARVGTAAVVRLANRSLVHGTLIDGATVEVQGGAQ